MGTSNFKLNLLLIFIFSFLTRFLIVHCEAVQCELNQHYYELVASETEVTYTEALEACKTKFTDKYGYLTTISSQIEWSWIKDTILEPLVPTTNPENIWIGGKTLEGGNIVYGDGSPESLLSNVNIYDFTNGKCTGFCDFQYNNPSNKGTGNLYLSNSADQFKWSNLNTLLTSKYYLCESGGLTSVNEINELVIGLAPTQTSDSSSVSLLYPSNIQNITGILFTSILTETPDTFTINFDDSSTDISIPSGSGIYLANLLTSSSTPQPTSIFSYQSPVITGIYPPISNEDLKITIVGENFGVNPSKILIKFATATCTNIQILKNHKAITCTLPNEIPNYLVVSIDVNGISSSENSRISIYDNLNNLFILNLNLGLSYDDNIEFIQGIQFNNQKMGYSNCITSLEQLNLLKSMSDGVQHIFWLPDITFDIVSKKFKDSQDNELNCYNTSLPTTSITGLMTFNLETSTYEQSTSADDLQESLVFFSNKDTPNIISSLSYQIPTTGKNIDIQLENYGFLLSNVQIQFTGAQDKIQVESNELGLISDFNIPSGYLDTELSILVDNIQSENKISISYLGPNISNVAWVDKENSKVEIQGENFYQDKDILVIQIGSFDCNTITVIEPSVKLQCIIDTNNKVGILQTTVKVGASPASTPFPFALSDPPAIDSIIGCAVNLSPLTISGSDFGNDSSLIDIFVDEVECTNILISTNTITCIIGEGSFTQFNVSVNVQGQNTIIPYTLLCQGKPTLTEILPVTFNENSGIPTITIIGQNLLTSSEITFTTPAAESFRVYTRDIQEDLVIKCLVDEVLSTSSKLICSPTSKPGNNAAVLIKVTNEFSTQITFTYTSIQITSVTQVQHTITIQGNGFGEGIAITPLDTITCTTTSDILITCTLNPTFTSSNISISNTLNSKDTFTFKVSPNIDNVNVNTTNSEITLTCSFIELKTLTLVNTYSLIENGIPLTLETQPTANQLNIITYTTQSSLSNFNTISLQVLTDQDIVPRLSNEMKFSGMPIINSLSIDTNNINSVIVQGDNFGDDVTKASITFTIVSVPNGTPKTIQPDSIKDSEIRFTIPNDIIAGEYTTIINIQETGSSNPQTLPISPVISEIINPVYNIPGITILGSKFCDVPQLVITIEDQPVNILSSNNTFIELDYPNTATSISTFLNIKISCSPTTNITDSYNYALFKLNPTIIQKEKIIQLTGNNLGRATDLTIKNQDGTITLTCTQLNPNEQINCTLPDNSQSGIWTLSTPVHHEDFELQLQPLLKSLLIDNNNAITTLNTIGGQDIQLSGFFFSSKLLILDGEYQLSNINYTYTSSNLLKYKSKSGVGKDFAIQLLLTKSDNSNITSDILTYSYTKPTISEIKNTENTLTIIGNNFGSQMDSNSISVEGYQVTNVSIDEVTKVMKLEITIPINSKSISNLILSVGEQSTDPQNYPLIPIIKKIDPRPITNGQEVTITGVFLYPDATFETYLIVNGDETKKTKLECNKTVTTQGTVTCIIPSGVDSFTIKMINTAGTSSSLPVEFGYSPPQITSVQYNYKPLVSAADITITGSSFGSKDILPTVTLNSTIKCINVYYIDDKTVGCYYKTQYPISQKVVVSMTVSKLTSTQEISLTYPKCSNDCTNGICTADKNCFCFYGKTKDSTCKSKDSSDDDGGNNSKKSSNGWKIAVGILVPVIVVLIAVGTVLYLRARKRSSYERYSNKYFMQMDNTN